MHEGEDTPQASHADRLAICAWNYLTDGQGGIDWSGLELIASTLGIDDLEDLMHRLLVIKLHKPPGKD